MHMDIFQVAASSTRLSVFFTDFPHHGFDISDLTCRPGPGNALGKKIGRENQVSNGNVSWVTVPDLSMTLTEVCLELTEATSP